MYIYVGQDVRMQHAGKVRGRTRYSSIDIYKQIDIDIYIYIYNVHMHIDI